MSEIFEGIVTPASMEEVRNDIDVNSLEFRADTILVKDGVCLIYHLDSRQMSVTPKESDRLARILSEKYGKALVFRYDSMFGEKWANLFIGGHLENSFDDEDAIWVLVDEKGMPITDGQRFQVWELDPDEEYDTLKGTLDLAFDAFGGVTWDEVHQAFYDHH